MAKIMVALVLTTIIVVAVDVSHKRFRRSNEVEAEARALVSTYQVETVRITVPEFTTQATVTKTNSQTTVEETKPIVEKAKSETSTTVEEKTTVTATEPKTTIAQIPETTSASSQWNGTRLNSTNGRIQGPSGMETYYNLPMQGVISIMRGIGNNDAYWVRSDGIKMLGKYVMVAANLNLRPRGSLVPTSLGTGIVCDTGSFAYNNPTQLDIAVAW